MHFSRLASAAGVALLLAGGSLAMAQQSPYATPPATAQASPHRHGGHGQFRHLLTAEQRAMWRIDHKADMASLNHAQRKAYKLQLREQFVAMNPREQARVRDQLQAEWTRLAPERQQKIEQRIAMRESRGGARHGGTQQQGYPREMGPPPSGSPSNMNQL